MTRIRGVLGFGEIDELISEKRLTRRGSSRAPLRLVPSRPSARSPPRAAAATTPAVRPPAAGVAPRRAATSSSASSAARPRTRPIPSGLVRARHRHPVHHVRGSHHVRPRGPGHQPDGRDHRAQRRRLRLAGQAEGRHPVARRQAGHRRRRRVLLRAIVDPKDPKVGRALSRALVRAARRDRRPHGRVHARAANVLLHEGLADRSCQVVPEGFDPKNPIGSGPFKMVDFKPGEQFTFAPSPTTGTAPPTSTSSTSSSSPTTRRASTR